MALEDEIVNILTVLWDTSLDRESNWFMDIRCAFGMEKNQTEILKGCYSFWDIKFLKRITSAILDLFAIKLTIYCYTHIKLSKKIDQFFSLQCITLHFVNSIFHTIFQQWIL